MDIMKLKQEVEVLYEAVRKLEIESSSADSYTKAQTDSLLSAKADKSTTYTKTETNAEIQGAITDLDVSSTAATGHYIKSIEQVDGKISAVAELLDTSPVNGSTKPITSGAVYEALQNAGGGTDLTTNVITVGSGLNQYIPADSMGIIEKHLPFRTSRDLSTKTYIFVGESDTTYQYISIDAISGEGIITYRTRTINKTSRQILNSSSQYTLITEDNLLSTFFSKWIPTSISSNTDLNTVTTPNVYSATAAVAATLTNCPTTSAFKLYTEYFGTAATDMIQRIQVFDTTAPKIYIRTCLNSTWGNWFDFSGTEIT